MNRRTKIPVWLILLVLILVGITPVFGQAQGYELYKKTTAERRSLISFDGIREVRWTPGTYRDRDYVSLTFNMIESKKRQE